MVLRVLRVLVVSLVAAASLVLVPSVAGQEAAVEWPQVGGNIDGVSFDAAGLRVSLSADGSRVAVGYPYHDVVNGDVVIEDVGEVRVFERTGTGVWTLLGADIDGLKANDKFGQSVSLSSDGSRVAVGAPNARPIIDGEPFGGGGQAQVFELNEAGTEWEPLGPVFNGRGRPGGLGASVSLSGDGSRVAIVADQPAGEPAQVFDLNEAGTAWTPVGVAVGGGDVASPVHTLPIRTLGVMVELSVDGSRLVVGSWRDVGIRVYDLDEAGTAWTQVGGSIAGGALAFGRTAALSGDGSRVAVGTPTASTVSVFALDNANAWAQTGDALAGTLTTDEAGTVTSDEFGWSVSLSSDGSRVAVGATGHDPAVETEGASLKDAGQVQVFEQVGEAWTPESPPIDGVARGVRFGYSVSLSADGNAVAAGAPGIRPLGSSPGRARVFRRNLAPEFIETFTSVEGKTGVGTVVATDFEGDTFTYTLSGGADFAQFDIDANSGALTFKTAPEFASPADADTDNAYQVEVTVTDVFAAASKQLVTIIVTKAIPPTTTTTTTVPVAPPTTTTTVAPPTPTTTVAPPTPTTTVAPPTTTTTVAPPTPTTTVPVVAACVDGADPDHPFVDVSRPSELSSNVGCLKELSVTRGTSAMTYSPKRIVTREETAAFLGRLYREVTGKDCGSPDHGFIDVPVSSYAYEEVGCLKELGVTRGSTSAITYSPKRLVTREEMAAFLGRLYREVTGKDCGSPDHGFIDVPVSSYAYEEVGCLKELGVTRGTSPTTYSPKREVTREEMAAFLVRLYRVMI